MTKTSEFCGCGKPIRYIVFKEDQQIGSCNKYARCPTYEELREINQKQLKLLTRAKIGIKSLLANINKIDTTKIEKFIQELP